MINNQKILRLELFLNASYLKQKNRIRALKTLTLNFSVLNYLGLRLAIVFSHLQQVLPQSQLFQRLMPQLALPYLLHLVVHHL